MEWKARPRDNVPIKMAREINLRKAWKIVGWSSLVMNISEKAREQCQIHHETLISSSCKQLHLTSCFLCSLNSPPFCL